MNAYLFASVITVSALRHSNRFYGAEKIPQTWDSCSNQIVFGSSLQEAHRRFETWLKTPAPDDDVSEMLIRKITGAQFVDRLLTESGNLPLDWTQVAQQVADQLEATPVDDFEQGYWVNVDQAVPAGRSSSNIDTLQNDVAEDIRSGLNWSPDKKFFFVLSVLAPLPAGYEADQAGAGENEDRSPGADLMGIGELYTTFPQALDKEAAVLIRARNSVVAAWLWRRYAANGPLATKTIRIDPWCEAINPK